MTPQTLEEKLKKVKNNIIDKLDIILSKLSSGPSVKRPVTTKAAGKCRQHPKNTNLSTDQMDLDSLAQRPDGWIESNTMENEA